MERARDDASAAARRPAELPAGYSLRAARMDDAADVFALIQRSELHDLGETVADLDELRSEWQTLPGFDLAHDTWLIVKSVSTPDPAPAPHERIVGYAWFQNERDHELLVGDHCVAPEERGRGLETVFMDRLEDRARFHAAKAAGGVSQMGVFGVTTHEYKPDLFRSRGYHKTSRSAGRASSVARSRPGHGAAGGIVPPAARSWLPARHAGRGY